MEPLPGDPYLAPGVTLADVDSNECPGCGRAIPWHRALCAGCRDEARADREEDRDES